MPAKIEQSNTKSNTKSKSKNKTNNCAIQKKYSFKFLPSGVVFIKKCDQGYKNGKLMFRLGSTITYVDPMTKQEKTIANTEFYQANLESNDTKNLYQICQTLKLQSTKHKFKDHYIKLIKPKIHLEFNEFIWK